MSEQFLNTESIKQFTAYLANHPKIAVKYSSIAMSKAALYTEGVMKREAPVKTGQLRKTITSTITPLLSTIKPTVNYAFEVNNGSPARDIKPRRAKVLRFAGKNGQTFAKVVHQKARKANPFVDRTREKVEQPVNNFFLEALQGVINELKNV